VFILCIVVVIVVFSFCLGCSLCVYFVYCVSFGRCVILYDVCYVCMMCVICVLRFIVVPLPPGKNPFAVKYIYIYIYIYMRNTAMHGHISGTTSKELIIKSVMLHVSFIINHINEYVGVLVTLTSLLTARWQNQGHPACGHDSHPSLHI
jgi:hypothetical protein